MAEPDTRIGNPRERLAASRAALLAELATDAAPPSRPRAGDEAPPTVARPDGWLAAVPWLPLGRRVAQRWWHRHPANAALQLARPALERRARERPAQLMLTAAATGAVLVVVRPWRLLSTTALLALLLKTSDIADVMTTLTNKKNPSPRKEEAT